MYHKKCAEVSDYEMATTSQYLKEDKLSHKCLNLTVYSALDSQIQLYAHSAYQYLALFYISSVAAQQILYH